MGYINLFHNTRMAIIWAAFGRDALIEAIRSPIVVLSTTAHGVALLLNVKTDKDCDASSMSAGVYVLAQ